MIGHLEDKVGQGSLQGLPLIGQPPAEVEEKSVCNCGGEEHVAEHLDRCGTKLG